MPDIDISAWLGAGYGVALLMVAYLIDIAARRATTQIESHRAGGFEYDPDHDAWVCPEDQWLYPQSFDPDNRVMRYRGSPSVCNACPVKDSCTTSDDGREMRRNVDTWPGTETAKFYRGIACSVTILAVLWPALTTLMVDDWASQLLSLVAGGAIALAAAPLWAFLARTKADPGVFSPVQTQTADETAAARSTAAERFRRRRTKFASDNRYSTPPLDGLDPDAPAPLIAADTIPVRPSRYASDRRNDNAN